MAEFDELLGKLREPGDDGVPETIYDDLAAAYNDRISSADSKISELSSTLDTTKDELLKVRAHNYDLLTAVQVGNPTGARGDTDKVNNPDEDIPVVSLSDIISYS